MAASGGTPAAITRQVLDSEAQHGWLTAFMPHGTVAAPLTNREIRRWHDQMLDTGLRADADAAVQRLVEQSAVPSPERFAQQVAAEADAVRRADEHEPLRSHPGYAALQRLPAADRAALAERFRRLVGETHLLEQRLEPWVRPCLNDLRGGRPGPWLARRNQLTELTHRARIVFTTLGSATHVLVQGSLAGLDTLARPLLEHLQGGSQLKLGADGQPKIAAWAARPVKQAGPLFERVRVNGAPPVTAAQVDAVLQWLEGMHLLDALDRTWLPAGPPSGMALHDRLQWHLSELQLLDRLLGLGAELHHEQQRCLAGGIPVNWTAPAETAAYVTLPDVVTTAEAASTAAHPLAELTGRLDEVGRWPDAGRPWSRCATPSSGATSPATRRPTPGSCGCTTCSTLTADAATWAEIRGYRTAMSYVLQLADDPHFTLDESLVRSLHYMMLAHDTSKSPGRYRLNSIFVVDEGRNEVVYEAPDFQQVPPLCQELDTSVAADATSPSNVRAAMAHLNLVMIHPFREGNGRIARCLQTLILARDSIVAPEFSSVEEFLGRNTPDYYAVLANVGQGAWNPGNDARPWVKFIFRAHHMHAQTVVSRLAEAASMWSQLDELAAALGVPERSAPAMYDAALGLRIRRSNYIRYAHVEERTATRDLQLLVDAGLLVPQGERRGRTYSATEQLRAVRIEARRQRPRPRDPYGGSGGMTGILGGPGHAA